MVFTLPRSYDELIILVSEFSDGYNKFNADHSLWKMYELVEKLHKFKISTFLSPHNLSYTRFKHMIKNSFNKVINHHRSS